jgi:hypothetical protein
MPPSSRKAKTFRTDAILLLTFYKNITLSKDASKNFTALLEHRLNSCGYPKYYVKMLSLKLVECSPKLVVENSKEARYV